MSLKKDLSKDRIISDIFSQDERRVLPVSYFLLREVEVFKSQKRMTNSAFHNSNNFRVGYLEKPISFIMELKKIMIDDD